MPQPAPSPCAAAAALEPLPFPETPDLSPVTLVPTQATDRAPRRAFVFSFERTNDQLEGHAPYLADLPILLELWSDEPNDYQGALFSVAQGPMEPSVEEDKWYAWLRERDARREQEAKAQTERAEREAKERAERAEREARERTLEAQRRTAERERKEREHAAFCAAHPEARECRPPEPVRVAQRPPTPARRVEPVRPLEPVRPAAPPAPQPRPAPGPPPIPPVETVPEQPTPSVHWVHGYWRWSGFEWAWLPGWWRIDEAEAAAAARRATAACPLPRQEARPPPPLAEAVWRPGAWVWGVAAWVWVPGAWHAAVPAR